MQLEYTNRGVKQANFYVLRNTSMPAILIECAFVDNKKDIERTIAQEISHSQQQIKLLESKVRILSDREQVLRLKNYQLAERLQNLTLEHKALKVKKSSSLLKKENALLKYQISSIGQQKAQTPKKRLALPPRGARSRLFDW